MCMYYSTKDSYSKYIKSPYSYQINKKRQSDRRRGGRLEQALQDDIHVTNRLYS